MCGVFDSQRVCVCVLCVCVCERERERERERACKVMREGGGKGGGANAGVRWSKYTGRLSCITSSPSPPPPCNLTPPLPILAAARAEFVTNLCDGFPSHNNPLHGLGCQISSAEWSGDLYSTFKL